MSQLTDLIKDIARFRILVVDDKANMRRTIRNMLRTLGFSEIREAEDGDVALTKIRSENLNFVICDWNMPRMNGVEALREVRADSRFTDLPFLMITAEVEEATVAESIEADVDGYILKPFIPKTLEDKMLEILNRKLAPSPFDTHLRLAEVYFKSRAYPKAHEELDKAAQFSPRSPKLHYSRGLLFEAEGDLQKAEKAFATARQVGPKFIKAHEKLAETYEKLGRNADKLQVLREAVRVSPKNAERQSRLGEALLADGRIQEAKKAFQAAIQIDPSPERLSVIGEAFLSNGLAQEAERSFKASLLANPDNVHIYNRLGIAFRRQKKFTEAVQLYQKALLLDPEDENLHYNLARAYFSAGQRDEAVLSLKAAVAINEDFTEARELLVKLET